MRSESDIIRHLTSWAHEDENIRAMWQWGSRADPRRIPDELSDYDIGILAQQKAPFAEQEGWLTQFGSIMSRWPTRPSPTFSERWLTQLVVYRDRVRIDFQITEAPFSLDDIRPEPYRLLLDKDGTARTLFSEIEVPMDVELPDEETYRELLDHFWWDILYVPKALARDEICFAKYMLETSIRAAVLEPLMRWYVALVRGREVDTGTHGRWVKACLPADLWNRYEATFAGARIADNWRALFATIEFTREIARAISERLGYGYPRDTDAFVSSYIRDIYGTSADSNG